MRPINAAMTQVDYVGIMLVLLYCREDPSGITRPMVQSTSKKARAIVASAAFSGTSNRNRLARACIRAIDSIQFN